METSKKWMNMGETANVKEASKYPFSSNNNAHSITKYWVLVRLDVQILALRAHLWQKHITTLTTATTTRPSTTHHIQQRTAFTRCNHVSLSF